MSEEVENLLKELILEQKKNTLYTFSLERDRLLGALMQAGLGVPVEVINNITLAPGAATTIASLIPHGFVYLLVGRAWWHTSLPFWCSYNLWINQTAPATPLWSSTRMAADEEAGDWSGLFPITAYLLHVVQNNHATETAYVNIEHAFVAISTETWEMIRSVYLDPVVAELRRKAEEASGMIR